MTKQSRLIMGFVLALNILIVWLPTRFQTAGIQEEWRIRALFDGHIQTYGDSGNETTDEIFYTRPVIGVLNQIAYWLTPDSFVSHHLILISLLFAKGMMLFLILGRLLPEFPLWGYISALLLIFYPSDPATVSLRVIHTHLAVVMILSSIYFLIRYYQDAERRDLVFMWTSQTIAGLTIEIGYPIFFFAPLIILILERRITRRFLLTTALFYIVPAITFLYSIMLILVVRISWQRTALGSYTVREYVHNIIDLYEYNLLTTWQNVVTYITRQATPADMLVFLSTTAVTLAGSLFIVRQTSRLTLDRYFVRRFLLLIVSGGVLILLGYAVFLPSRTHVLTHYRVYLLSSVGLAILTGTIIYGLFHSLSWKPLQYVALFIFSIIVGLSSAYANKTHQANLEISNQQESLVRQIADVAPAFNDDVYIVIRTTTNGMVRTLPIGEIQKPVLFTPMLQYIYDDYQHIQSVISCFTLYLDCTFDPSGMDIIATNYTGVNPPLPYDQMIIFIINKQGQLALLEQEDTLPGYAPLNLIHQDAPPPRRIQTLYGDAD